MSHHHQPTATDPDTGRLIGFLDVPVTIPAGQDMFDEDVADFGYVTNISRLWAYQPETMRELFELVGRASSVPDLSLRQRGILIAACASALGDSYCSLVWGGRLAAASSAPTAAAVLRGEDEFLNPSERALARWARAVARDPNATTPADVQILRDAGFSDAQIFAITVFVALRLAFSTVNDALGLPPDAALRRTAPPDVLHAVTRGRPIDVETP